MNKDYIEINKDLIPYKFNISLADEIFTIEVKYNSVGGFFTLTLYKDDELICAGEKLVYGVPLFQDVFVHGKFPALTIIPIDESGGATAVTFENLGETVFLVVDNGA